ncbi:MAG: acetyl-CoA hydrolase/transferase family protein [Candidatus Azobacteroides sp.]|nr:acetyl-CoA hydrolase/transferase family protein [Candidatus Azobacteroides sp.]
MSLPFMTAAEAAKFIKNGDAIGFSGFTSAGAPKAVTSELAKIAEAEHAKGNPFKVGMYTGASTSDMLDGALARANAVLFRTPYQSHKDLRAAINNGEAPYYDLHLSQIAQELRYGFLKKVDVAIMEACDISEDGTIILTTGVGISPTIAHQADKIIIELNHHHSKSLKGMHDLYEPAAPPYRKDIPIYTVRDRIGTPYLKVDPKKIVAVVETDLQDGFAPFTPPNEVTVKIGDNVAKFLASELKKGIIPKEFLPIQSGVGNIANAVMDSLGKNPEIPTFTMYTEVIQESIFTLMKEGHVSFASGSSLTITEEVLQDMYSNMDFFHDKLVLRPQEISNNPEVIRRLGLITINTALEADIFGNINSTHVTGTRMMNGIGGSGDFTRNAFISIFTTPSVAKGGKISAFVPMVSHHDHSEHSVKVIISEYGIADLRAKAPIERAKAIIENCVHPDYKQLLWDYLKLSKGGHSPQNLYACFAMHQQLQESGDMRNTDWSKY